MFDRLDGRLVKHLLVEYVDCRTLLALSLTNKQMYEAINGDGGVCDELLFRISPFLTDHRRIGRSDFERKSPRFTSKLHAITFYEDIRKAKKQFMVSCGEGHTVIAVKSNDATENYDRVLTFGIGGSGRLGHGNSDDQAEACEVLIKDEDFLRGSTFVKSVVGGMNHTIVLLQNGKIYGFGDNSFGQLGPNLPLEEINTPHDLKFPKEKISMISCAKNYTAIVLNDAVGTVIVLGMGLNAETLKYKDTNFRQLMRGDIKTSERITDVSAGYHHLLLISSNGVPYSVGSNRFGQLGTGENSSQMLSSSIPVSVKFHSKINPVAQVAAGENHSMLLTRDGNLFTWGNGQKGQLGTGSFSREVDCPQEILLPGKCFPIIITCGNNHSVVLDLDGKVHTCGSNGFGQTATVSKFFAVPRFSAVSSGEFEDRKKMFRKLIHIAAGSNHTAVLGKSSRLFMFGQTEKCGGGGFIRQFGHKTTPVQVDLSGSIQTYSQNNKFFTARYMRR